MDELTPYLDTIHCMDALELCAQLPPQSVDMILTDPPYGVTDCEWDVRVPFDEMWEALRRVIKPKGAIVMTATEPFASELRLSWREGYRYDWVWDKLRVSGWLDANRKPLRVHENILIFSDSWPDYHPQITIGSNHKRGRNEWFDNSSVYSAFENTKTYSTGFYPKSILTECAILSGHIHPTQKPVALFDYLIRTYTLPGEIVLDPFCGSGTTAVACRNLQRHYICGDMLQEYVDGARERVKLAPEKVVETGNGAMVQTSLLESIE